MCHMVRHVESTSYRNCMMFSGECRAGTYRNSDMTSCNRCEVVNTISTGGATSCTDCPAGTEANEERIRCGE